MASKANRILKSGTFQPDSERMPPKVSQPVRIATQPFHTVKTGGSNPAKSATESRSDFRWISDNRGCRGSKSRNHDKTTNRRNAHEIKDCRACGSNYKRWSGRRDSNPRPPRPERGALPGCATPRHGSHGPWANRPGAKIRNFQRLFKWIFESWEKQAGVRCGRAVHPASLPDSS
jgi:hypothetical protein